MEEVRRSSFPDTKSIAGWLIILNIVSYLFAIYRSGTFNSLHPRFAELGGAADSILMASGQWWRVFTGVFFHFGLPHLLLNCMGLKFLGERIEPVIGGKLFLLVYLTSGVFSTLASSFVHTSVGGGASGAIFGIVGVGVVLEFLMPKDQNLASTFSRQGLWKERLFIFARRYSYLTLTLVNVIFALVVNLVFWLFGIRVTIDNTAHLTGLASGALVFLGAVLVLKKQRNFGVGLLAVFICFFAYGSHLFFRTSYVADSFFVKAAQEKDPGKGYYFYSQALRISPKDPKLLFGRGKLAFDYGDLLAAIKDFEKVVAMGFPKEHFEVLLSDLAKEQVYERAVVLSLLERYPKSSQI